MPVSEPQPTWEIALLYPNQGEWTESDYLALDTNRLVELVVDARKLGKVIFAPLRIRIRPKTMREPDIIYISRRHYRRIGEEYWTGADLVVEVVSPDKRSQKQYAQRRIAEYWIVDPQKKRISVLSLKGKSYRVHGEFVPGQQAASVLLEGFVVDVDAVFAAGKSLD
jgi:Uma2 family endonuclease